MTRALTLSLVLALGTPFSSTPRQGALASLSWLAGCWEMREGTTIVEEQWMRPGAGVMVGMGRAISGGALREVEQLSIREEGAGLVYRATPAGQAPTEFRSVSLAPGDVTFANPAHDFPQRIRYRRAGSSSDSLYASIEGPMDGRLRVLEYPYRRVPCANP